MKDKLILIFTRNPELGKVKTRLAKTVGDNSALEVYKHLLQHTEKTVKPIPSDKAVFYTVAIRDNDIWDDSIYQKHLQQGNDLGERMQHAFELGFAQGYKQIIIIGSDLLDLDETVINDAFNRFTDNDVVFGPAEDGGYYLLGLSKMNAAIFTNKPWSETNLLDVTLNELKSTKTKVSLLKTLNDIDTYEDLKASAKFSEVKHLIKYD